MKRIVLVLLLAAMSHAQEVRGPYDLGIPYYSYSDTRLAYCGPDTIDLLTFSPYNDVSYWAFSQAAESLVVGPTSLLQLPEGWVAYTTRLLSVENGWVAVVNQELPETDFDYGYNRLVMIYKENGAIGSVVLDSGRTHPYWTDSLSRKTTSVWLTRRLDGGFYLGRSYQYGEQDSLGMWQRRWASEVREYADLVSAPVYRDVTCSGFYLSGPGDSLYVLSYDMPEEQSISGCLDMPGMSVDLPVWTNCVLQRYNLMFVPDLGLRLLTGYSPVLYLKSLQDNGSCVLVSEVRAVAEHVIAHPNYGYALITGSTESSMFGQIDLDGQLFRPPTPVAEQIPYFQGLTIAENGDVVILWHRNESGYTRLMLLIIPWDAVLDTPEPVEPVVPRELALAAYPNPFNSAVTIRYDLPQAGNVELAVFDLQGRLVETLRDEVARAGSHELSWSPRNAASGVYFLRFESSVGRATHKLLYLK